jgi:hypothetical protein
MQEKPFTKITAGISDKANPYHIKGLHRFIESGMRFARFSMMPVGGGTE